MADKTPHRPLSPTAWRTTPLPATWDKIRKQVLRRDGYRCTWRAPDPPRTRAPGVPLAAPYAPRPPSDLPGGAGLPPGRRCPVTDGLEVDHIGPPDDHSPENLRALCGPHHRAKTAAEANAAKQARRKRAEPRHPGLL